MLDYSFYVDEYGGSKIAETDWKNPCRQAQRTLEFFIGEDLPENYANVLPAKTAEAISLCICELAETLQQQEAQVSGLASESTDGYSVSYLNKGFKEQTNELYSIALKYLSNTGLLYCGFKRMER